jgi:hypothetical protein
MNYRVWLLGAALLGMLGCSHSQTRLQAPDETDHDSDADILTVGKITNIANAEPIPISGVGLVVGLSGTGGDAPPGTYRTFLEDKLRKRGVERVREILASPDNSMVLVSAQIPAGVRKGDPIDVEVTLPPGSKTSSLRGGYLKECFLYNYDSAKNLSPTYDGANRLLLGHALARAEGPVMIGWNEGEQVNPCQGRIWGGARSKIDRGFYVVMDKDHQSAPIVQRAAERINETFHGPARGMLADVAVAKTKVYLTLSVPQQYRLNVPHFLRVVRAIPLRETPPEQSPYRKHLEEQLLDPARTVTAAIRLEALGPPSIPVLKSGLQSEHALVRFASAQALAYLDCSACGEELARLIEQQPSLRAFGLTAMASLDEAVSRVKLQELLASPSADTRYGAFRALRTLDENHPAVQGKLLSDSFWLHRVAPGSPPLVHLSTSRRAEVVLFGEEPSLVPPFYFRAGEFTITAPPHDQRCTITRRSVYHSSPPVQCSLRLDDVLQQLAADGGTYPEVVELLRQVGTYRCASCPVAIDALPQAVSVFDLAREGAANSEMKKPDEEIIKAQGELGATPTLYERTNGQKPRPSAAKLDADQRQPGLERQLPDG